MSTSYVMQVTYQVIMQCDICNTDQLCISTKWALRPAGNANSKNVLRL